MRHNPGIKISHIQHHFHGQKFDEIEGFVLTRGVDGVLQVQDDTITGLKNLGKKVWDLRTEEALELYKSLSPEERAKVVAFVHTTC
mmetsp:Transcript_7525/g.5713  ORF Transcript_7525/g.5713 Transcript_7525/m.5713 type:complete len:86 (+) Transcript_7525:244-501(+)|eukprot:CAMPEP_0202958922 /NCGR_PEP_ID=MMETSP1396-20130829/3190_1 /ASSEMBLY_ACC=CAM_ASM_000872 /TAXON_ID= /ORGANISM="Pseudokeronopsis sp., Strain Brazil" /LENGTH=85 /DNA_ID=CAMNT_0049677233 /DNA_START=454 /DNA_END=711 /DNA_ORIENTATION=-